MADFDNSPISDDEGMYLRPGPSDETGRESASTPTPRGDNGARAESARQTAGRDMGQSGRQYERSSTPRQVAVSFRVSKEIIPPTFNIVDIDTQFAAQILGSYVSRGSMMTGIDVGLINTTVDKMPLNDNAVTVNWLVRHGMRVFDAIVWISAEKNARPPLRLPGNVNAFKVATSQELAKAMFYCYFFLLTQARYPADFENGQRAPAFLTKVMGLNAPPSTYMKLLCSFNANLFDARWIKHVSFKGFGQESLSRFGLGVAGYRCFAPFKVMVPSRPLDREVRSAFEYARTVALSPPTWTVHPITRAPALLTERGNLNKNLGNLMLRVYSLEELTMLKETRQIYDVPKYQPGFDNWMNWSANPGIAIEDPIFP